MQLRAGWPCSAQSDQSGLGSFVALCLVGQLQMLVVIIYIRALSDIQCARTLASRSGQTVPDFDPSPAL
ncbi:conserved protein of unknown function [Ectopseudomonas oleovorans]|uniref:Uncharacterized protein n=1 Tax=Ectopseudomonas oleovorans TaxID=301 RepID=A0A653AXK6_ECTOL|nr:conserved protein of unknown function [Pseudomonas oleovorans]